MSGISELKEGGLALGLALTDVQCDQLLAYSQLILKWNKVYNLTALRASESVLTHHLLDSLAVIAPLRREAPEAMSLLDVGSGAGLPGIVISLVCPSVEVTCVDAVAKKTAFIQQAASELGLRNLRSIHSRVESLQGSFSVVASRAFASLTDFFSSTQHLLEPSGVWLAMKGKRPDEEIASARPLADMFHVEQVNVPGLQAERCIVWARKPAA